ncbi:MAG: Gfo/Idh/MocA family oxidoreductase [Planctomycetota bacterium]|nr:Gfo/Idh/MocA family oxidoreductase [Planctomycetota bacterium]
MYKCAMLGCGPRARGHAAAYKHVQGGNLSAICDMNEERLDAFSEEFGIETKYTSYEEMLEKEKPEVLHIITPPTIRHSVMQIASDANVPAVVIEKPIAIQAEDFRDLVALSESTNTKFCVNTQLNFHPANLRLKQLVNDGRIGDIKFIDASARSTPIDQGPHVLQLVSSYIDNSRPTQVFGNISGGENLAGRQPSPDDATATIFYENGVRTSVSFGLRGGPHADDNESRYQHKRVAVYGTEGFAHWRMNGWECYTKEDGYESGVHGYGEEDILGQAGLTEAIFAWLDDDNNLHPTHLDQSLAEFNLLMGMYHSGMTREPISLPFDPPDNIIESMQGMFPAE